MSQEKKITPPYVAFKTFLSFLEKLRVGIPARIDRSIAPSFSGAVQVQIFTALKFLRLMSDNNIPTDLLRKLVSSEGPGRRGIFREIVTSGYPFLFGEGFDLQNTTPQLLQKAFEDAGASGGTTRKSIKFFMGITKEAGIELSPHLKHLKLREPRGTGRVRKIARQNNAIPSATEKVVQDGGTGSSEVTVTWQELMLNKFPTFDPAWSDEVKIKWFEAFKELFEFKKE